MKKTARLKTVLLLACMMVLFTLGAALAEDGGDSYVPERIRLTEINRSRVKVEQEGGEVEYEAVYEGRVLSELEVELELVDGTEYEVLYDANGNILRAEYETGAGEIIYDGAIWWDSAGNAVSGPDLTFMYSYFEDYQVERTSYPHNMMCVAGLPLRELEPSLTKRWYHILPVDLTQEGVFRYRMLVSNMYYMGYCQLTIQDGKVTTDYTIPNGIFYPERQCLAWFTDLGEITAAFLENPQSDFRFGEPVDIQEKLKGQEIALLFICNQVSYQLPLDQFYTVPARMYTTSEAVVTFRQGLKDLLARMEAE